MRMNTNYLKGGNNEELLDNNFIITNLKELLNNQPLKYKFDIKNRIIRGTSTLDVFVENSDDITKSYNLDDDPCLSIILYNTKEGISIGINEINKCIPINNYGNFILNSIKEFAKKYGYYSVIINVDASTIILRFYENGNIENIYLDIAKLSILSTGKSWYNKMGFYNPMNKEQIQDNKYKIRKDIRDIDEPSKIIEFIDNKLKQYKKTPICFKLVNSYGKFRNLYNFILDLTKKTETNSIQEVFQEINNIIKINCNTNTNTCIIDYETMLKIDCFIMFIYNLLDINYNPISLIYIVPNSLTSQSAGNYLKNKIARRTKKKLIGKKKIKSKKNYKKLYK